MGAAPSITCVDPPNKGDGSVSADALPVQDQQHAEEITLQPKTGANRLPTTAEEGQKCLLDHVVLKDILRVLGDSRSASFSAPELYASLQVQYLQRIPDSQAENQGRLLVYLEWLTERLLQDSLTAKHEKLYAAVLKLCKASEVARSSSFMSCHNLCLPSIVTICCAHFVFTLGRIASPA